MTTLPDCHVPRHYETGLPIFELGQLAITPAAIACLEQAGVSVFQLLARHAAADFGDLCADDIRANLQAITSGARILSSYQVGNEKVYLITEGSRETTTTLLAREY